MIMSFIKKRPSTRTLALHCGAWAMLTLYFVFPQTINGAVPSFGRTVTGMGCVIAGYYLNTLVLVNRLFETRRYVEYVCVTLGIIAVGVALNIFLEYTVWGGDMLYKAVLEPHRYVMLLIWVSLAFVFVGLFLTTQSNRRRTEHETEQMLTKHKEAEVQFLRSQINPHFLFNTLNNIYALAVVGSSQTAPMLMRLSKLLRYAIYTAQQPTVTLQDEVAQIRELLTLYSLRTEEPINISFTTEGLVGRQSVEPMILFSLVENCLKHSDIAYNAAGFVAISLEAQANKLIFRTHNSKDDTNKQKDATGGVGLHNIRQRLALKYGKYAELTITNTPTQFDAVVKLPLIL
jgi:hypothetical protein